MTDEQMKRILDEVLPCRCPAIYKAKGLHIGDCFRSDYEWMFSIVAREAYALAQAELSELKKELKMIKEGKLNNY